MIVAELSGKRPYVTRKRHLKVKSGCLTCKWVISHSAEPTNPFNPSLRSRRVKCDETRPSCLRCIKFGTNCGGYTSPIRFTPQQSKAILLRKPLTQTLPEVPSSSRFDNDEQFKYFEIFSKSTAYELFPNVEMGTLRLMFLQTCEFKDSIRLAVIALGALEMTSQAPRSTASHHYQYAIKQYARAIKSAQMDVELDIRTACITSLVILSFEGWVGNHEAAVKQIRIGTRLLKEWKERYRERTMSGVPTSEPSDEENVLSHVFTRLSIQMRSPPREHPPHSLASLPPLQIDVPESFGRMPKSFCTLAEAGKFYNAIVRFAVTFVSQALPRIARASSLTGTYSVGKAEKVIPPEIAKAQAALTEGLRRWMSAFSPLKTSHNFKSLAEKKASLTLELHMKATYMGTVKSLAQDELVFDDYYDMYKDIVNLSEDLLLSSKSSEVPKFRFDSGVIIPLWFTGHKCRDPILRRRVISLLIKYPRREGVWDSVFAGLIIDCLRGFEEEYMENGKVPGWARIRTTSFDVDLKTRIVDFRCQQRVSATSEEVVMRQKTFDYYIHTGIALEHVGALFARS
ncbi:Aspercryptin biosynthesis cluster-specific transcription regulator atnN [Hyphodiscus hymeniophilus]|uniref:Aspercryptin biosynthesis cluster-specific transcription regulator atnN n=1 Tax=Hyphodiscus hymeniophilus TaxID=353542 RepID=A0A9P6VHM4_9HELO|nr:Aspercryptin biosynthesis cluster-specific transcription regulator atnN [Hyphodiscus hymeniophilus]